MATKGGLGKGLGALLGEDAVRQDQQQGQGTLTLPISQVQPGLNQPRKHFDEEALAELAASIEQHGVLQPLTVRRLSSGYYQIIAGERRWRAAGLAALSGAPTVLGAALGYCLGTLGPTALTLTLSFAAGAMLYVIFGELLPESEQLWQSRLSGLSTMLGMLLGMALIFTHIH